MTTHPDQPIYDLLALLEAVNLPLHDDYLRAWIKRFEAELIVRDFDHDKAFDMAVHQCAVILVRRGNPQ